MSFLAGASGVLSAGSSIISGIGSLFGNNRDEKRENRKKLKQALYQAGVNTRFASNTHSDDWGQLKQLVDWISSGEQEAKIQFINDEFGNRSTFGSTKNGVRPNTIISQYDRWKQQQIQMQANKSQPDGSTQNARTQGRSSGGVLSGNLPMILLLAGGIYFISNN